MPTSLIRYHIQGLTNYGIVKDAHSLYFCTSSLEWGPCPTVSGNCAGAFGWRLSNGEMSALDKESGKLKPGLANPVENF